MSFVTFPNGPRRESDEEVPIFHPSVVLVSVEAAAEMLGIGRTKCFELVHSEALQSVLIGKRRLVSVRAIEEFVARLEAG